MTVVSSRPCWNIVAEPDDEHLHSEIVVNATPPETTGRTSVRIDDVGGSALTFDHHLND